MADDESKVANRQSKIANVLVIDEEPIIGASVKAALEAVGHTVRAVRSEGEAMEALAEPFDVVFVHRGLPDSTCDEIVRAARAHDTVAIILMSSERSEQAEKNKLRLGADEIVYKPLDPLELRAIVERHLKAERQPEVPGSPRILVVDDDEIVVRAVTDTLKGKFEVTGTQSPEEALRILQATPHEILLVDLMMEEMYGMDIIRAVRNIHPLILAIVMTGYASKDTAVEALKEGAYDFLEKPLTPEIVTQTVVRAWKALRIELENRKLLAELRRTNEELEVEIKEHKWVEEERKELEARLFQAQKMEAIGTLAGGVAHNFNNLLMAIQGNVSLMLFDIDSTHSHYEFLTTIKDEIKKGAQLARQLLGYARKGKFFPEPINLNELVEKTSEVIGRVRKEVSVHRELAKDLFAIEADQSQIEQVLLNLFINATDAMPGGGDLILKTANATDTDMGAKAYDVKPGDYVRLTVTDTGSGMDKETQERIFEPFFTTKEMGRGTGLGLASVYGIIKGHGGYIDVDSGLGRGTTFTIYLPATEEKVEETVQPAEEIVKGNGTILLVDDEAEVLKVGTIVLNRLGYTVLEATGGTEAVEIYKDNKDKIDLVLLDMIMPGMGGGEAYDRMKEINPKVKVLLASGYSIDSQAKEILARGCDAFIQKPFGMQELSQKIGEILNKK